MKKILGLDLGTNSIGWAVINSLVDDEGKEKLTSISSCGSRIIPMDAATLGDFDKGNAKSPVAERTRLRGIRRLLERSLLRRERLHRVLSVMGFLPEHYASQLDRYGKFLPETEPKLAWYKDNTGSYRFLFQDSFNEMLEDFRLYHPELVAEGKKIPYDWTIYYLRKKALSQKIAKEELAWILLNFNQKRGYYQLRGEEEQEDNKKSVEYYVLKVVAVEDSGERKGKDIWYNVKLENGWIDRRASSVPLDWTGKVKEFVVTTDLDDAGNPKKDKDGNVKRFFRAPKENDWGLLKTKTQTQIDESGQTVGAYIYDSLLRMPDQKIRGKLVRTIERKYYKDELRKILLKQTEFHAALQDHNLLLSCIEELYPNNEAHRRLLSSSSFTYFLLEDILFYQRPLKSQKGLIDDCPYESHVYRDKKDGSLHRTPLKCISKSHPLFQEFRLWHFLSFLRIYQRERMIDGSLKLDVDVTNEFLQNEDDYVKLFDWLNGRKEIDQKTILAYKPFGLKKNEQPKYRWNYVEDKSYPCNETRADMISRLSKAGVSEGVLTEEREEALWHILYSISDKKELTKALGTFAEKNGLNEAFVEQFSKMPPFESNYAAYSLKAIRKLLALMRMGKYWNEQDIDKQTRSRIEKILTGEYDETIRTRVREKAIHLTDISSFRGLPLWLACYVVYNRHSEAKELVKWETPADIDHFLSKFRQHSLRNPIVEQVLMETLRTVRDIWKQEGQIDEIHVELGREMKNPAKERARITAQVLENENTNLRIKALLTEFMNPEFEIENVRPYSPGQQEILRIYEEGVLSGVAEKDLPEDIISILKKFKENDVKKRPTTSEVLRYKLWLEQRYRSPYTGRIIPLGKLFTPAYEIEHVIPQSRYFDDSISNKVICESAVNKLKDNCLGYEFIKKHSGEIVELGNGEKATVFTSEEYEHFVKESYLGNGKKMKKLLLEDIPDNFIERQLNDSRYISKVVKSLLSNIVCEEGEQEGMSKNVIVCTGGVTDRLKKDWGVQDVWNRIILPRFLRLNKMTDSTDFTSVSTNGHLLPALPLHLQKGFNKKRIDHRHHAMDAIVIACADRNIVNYLNNASARKGSEISRYDLQHLLCDKVKTDSNGNYKWMLRKPWDTFTQDVYTALTNIVVSFKQNLRVINRTTNYYQHYNESGEKKMIPQVKGDRWAIRKPMHKDTVYGEVNLRREKTLPLKDVLNNPSIVVDKSLKSKLYELLKAQYDLKAITKYFEAHQDVWADINLKKIKVYYFTKETNERFFATRKSLDSSFNQKKIQEEVTDTGIQRILLRHLQLNDNNPDIAFSPDGIERMNQNMNILNDGKGHQPIYKVRTYEKAEKFAVGEHGNKVKKFVEAAKGTNLFFAVYESIQEDEATGKQVRKRTFATIPLNEVIKRKKQGLSVAPEDSNGNLPIFVLSPNDLVYLPTEEERNSGKVTQPLDRERIYKMVSCTEGECHFIPSCVASPILQTIELGSNNKAQRAWSGEMIKDICVPIKIDRLGNVSINY